MVATPTFNVQTFRPSQDSHDFLRLIDTDLGLEYTITEMLERMKHSLDNLSIVADEYAYFCKSLIESPDMRLQFWLDRK